MPSRVLFSIFALCACFSSACSSSSDSGGSATGSTCPSDSTLTYQNFGQAFASSYCSACHAGREQPNLTTQAAIVANRDEIDRVAAAGPNATNTQMPEDGSVSSDERLKLGEWLACGAP